MLIRDTQMREFARLAESQFAAELVKHVRTKFEFPAAYVPHENVQRLVHESIERARRYEFQGQGPLRLFVDFSVLLGFHFDEDPQLFWVSDLLHGRADSDEMSHATRLHMHVTNYLDSVYGERGELAIPALGAMSHASPEDLAAVETGLPESILRWADGLHRQKSRYAGRDGMDGLLGLARRTVEEHHLSAPGGLGLVYGLQFAFGSGVFDDPLYPWLADTLRENSGAGPAERVRRLTGRSLAYIRRVHQVVTRAVQGEPDSDRGR